MHTHALLTVKAACLWHQAAAAHLGKGTSGLAPSLVRDPGAALVTPKARPNTWGLWAPPGGRAGGWAGSWCSVCVCSDTPKDAQPVRPQGRGEGRG